ncbi:steroid-binding protein [Clostridium frigoris]|uniref:Steroid-binding protein n=1 Tax=Clostridium frigoris TaxID=205327 RepID=A0ABS6BRP1_9CLOT|nr:cytochrome b5 domain-containing protein [Clostridium frigoris]MBU3159593.1 steroid-binding protein [Clostridium frigoris]
MLIYYPDYYLVPVKAVMSLDDEYKYTIKRNIIYRSCTNVNKDIIKENFEVIYKRQQKFTLEELSKYNGIGGNAAYISVNGIVYDVSSVQSWTGGTHFGLSAGSDATKDFNTCHAASKILDKLPKVGVIIG